MEAFKYGCIVDKGLHRVRRVSGHLDVGDGEQVFALMRARIQCLSRTCFAFLGSARNSMLSIFLSPKSPFYKSAIVFDVGDIPDDDFYVFAKGRFLTGRRKLPRETFDRILANHDQAVSGIACEV